MGYVFNPFTGNLDFSGDASSSSNNFSYREIVDGITVNIPIEQEMILISPITIEGFLEVDGSFIQDEFVSNAESFTLREINAGELIEVPERAQYLVEGVLLNDGTLHVDGELSSIVDSFESSLPWFEIPIAQSVYVPEYREHFTSDFIHIDGQIQVDGLLSVGA